MTGCRGAELRQVREGFEAAFSGDGRLITLVGAPNASWARLPDDYRVAELHGPSAANHNVLPRKTLFKIDGTTPEPEAF